MSSQAHALRAASPQAEATTQEAFEQMLAMIAQDPAQQEEFRQLFAPLLSGEMDYAQHRHFLEEHYGRPE